MQVRARAVSATRPVAATWDAANAVRNEGQEGRAMLRQFRSPRRGRLIPVTTAIAATLLLAGPTAAAPPAIGPSTTTSPYLLPVAAGVHLTSMLTVGDGGAATNGYELVGVPDGLGMMEQGANLVLYMNQEGRGIGLINKLKAYHLQENGMDTVEANLELGFKMDQRDYGIGAQILRSLNVSKMKLMSNNPKKRAGLIGYGLEIVENVPIEIASNPHNENYLRTKRDKMDHAIMKDH